MHSQWKRCRHGEAGWGCECRSVCGSTVRRQMLQSSGSAALPGMPPDSGRGPACCTMLQALLDEDASFNSGLWGATYTIVTIIVLCFYSLRGLLYSSREYHVPSPVTQIWVGSKCLLRLELFTLPATPPRSWGPVLTSSENVGFKVSPMRPPQAAPRPCRCS
jgi:hypothetical protein